MEDNIRKAIEENLPQQVGEVLKGRLDKVDSLELEVAALKDKVTELREHVSGHRTTIEGFKDRVLTDQGLNTRKNLLNEREDELHKREVEVELVDLRAAMHLQGKQDILMLTQIVFRSPVFRRTIQEQTTEPNPDPNRAYETINKSSDKTITDTVE